MNIQETISTSVPATRWRNPTQDTVSFTLNIEGVHRDALGQLIPTRVRKVVVAPGEEVVLPSEFDDAIQKVRDGKIQSGHAPQLLRMADGKPVPTQAHPALIPSASHSVSKPSATDSMAQEARLRARLGATR